MVLFFLTLSSVAFDWETECYSLTASADVQSNARVVEIARLTGDEQSHRPHC